MRPHNSLTTALKTLRPTTYTLSVLVVMASEIISPHLIAQHITSPQTILQSDSGHIRAHLPTNNTIESFETLDNHQTLIADRSNTRIQPTIQAPQALTSIPQTLPHGQYESVFSVGSPDHHITFREPVTIEIDTTLTDQTPLTIYTSSDAKERSLHGYATVSDDLISFQTDHFTYFAVSDISGDFVINDDDTRTDTASVTLQQTITGAVSMRFGNTTAERDAAAREPYASTKAWTLTGGLGNHTVYAAFQNSSGDIVTISDDIIWALDVATFDTTNLRMRYDAADVSTITESAGLVTQRRDKSGNNNHANGITTASQPTRTADPGLGINVLDFDGSSDYMAMENIFYNSANIDGLFVCTVFKTDYNAGSYNSNRSFIDFDRSEFYDFYIQGNGRLEMSYTAGGAIIDAPVTNGGIYNNNQRHYACGRYDSSVTNDTEIYVNGIREYSADRRTTGTPIGKSTTRYGFIGDGSEAGSYNSTRNNIYYDGQLAEILVFDDITTISQRHDVMCYLSSKRGIGDACDDTYDPISTIQYSTTNTTPLPVVATLTNLSETITITNNGGSSSHIFTENGSFTFTYEDLEGNPGSITATVNWIDPSSAGATNIVAGGMIQNLDQTRKTVYFDRSYGQTPIVIATPTTDTNTNNSPFVRIQNVTTESFQISLCIDAGVTDCAAGSPEDVSYTVWDRDLIITNPNIDAGIITTQTNGSTTAMNFNKTFSNTPYVFLTPQTNNQGATRGSVARATNISTSAASFVGCIHNAATDACLGGQPNENVGYVAFDPNNFIEVGFQKGEQAIGNSSWTSITYDPYTETPIINVAINTESGAQDPVYPRARSVTTSTADIRYCEQDGANDCDTHNAETTRWITLPESANPVVTISAPDSLTMNYHTKSTTQTITKTFTGQHFSVSDESGYNIGRYTTVSMTDLIGPETIPSSTIGFGGGSVITLSGATNTNITNYITSLTDISTPTTLLERTTGPNGLKTGIYGITPSLQVTLPARITPGTYTGTITHTLYEYSKIQ